MDIHRRTFLLPVLSEFMKNVKKFEFLPPLPESDGHGFAELLLLVVTQSCLTLCDPVNRSTPGLPVHHQLPEFTQTSP